MIIFSLQSHTFLMNRLHWRCLLGNRRRQLHMTVLALATLGDATQIGLFIFMSRHLGWPKKVRHVTATWHCRQHYRANFRHWKHGFKGTTFSSKLFGLVLFLVYDLKTSLHVRFCTLVNRLGFHSTLDCENVVRNIILYLSWPLKTHLTL
jgi:hypothetical protein